MLLNTPEPWFGMGFTFQMPASSNKIPRWNSVRPVAFLIASVHSTLNRGSGLSAIQTAELLRTIVSRKKINSVQELVVS